PAGDADRGVRARAVDRAGDAGRGGGDGDPGAVCGEGVGRAGGCRAGAGVDDRAVPEGGRAMARPVGGAGRGDAGGVRRASLERLAGGPVFSRCGINSGPMIVGNMGSSAKFNYTVLGDSVNLASRLEGANKMYGTRILITQATADLVGPQFVVRKVDLLRVKG